MFWVQRLSQIRGGFTEGKSLVGVRVLQVNKASEGIPRLGEQQRQSGDVGREDSMFIEVHCSGELRVRGGAVGDREASKSQSKKGLYLEVMETH